MVRRSAAPAGGAQSDLGCYCTSAMRVFGGEPSRVYAEAVYDGVDMRFAATLRPAIAQATTYEALARSAVRGPPVAL